MHFNVYKAFKKIYQYNTKSQAVYETQFIRVISSFYVRALLRKYISYQDFHMQEMDYSYKLRILFLIINPRNPCYTVTKSL
jgi:hypothetical protein